MNNKTVEPFFPMYRPGSEGDSLRLRVAVDSDGRLGVYLERQQDQAWRLINRFTALPDRAAAIERAQRLMAAKQADGYLTEHQAVPPVEAPAPTLSGAAVARLLADIEPDGWRLLTPRRRSRLVWRLGERRVAQAVPRLVELLNSGDAMLDYCLAWAIGRCGDAGARPALEPLMQSGRTEAVRRMATLASLELADAGTRADWAGQLIADWPFALRDAWAGRDAEQILKAARELATWQRFSVADWLESLDLVAQSQPVARQALIALLAELPLAAGQFRAVRRLYKAAEFRGDGEIWALLQRRFESVEANFRRSFQDQRVELNGKWVRVEDELTRADSRLAYSNRTRDYLLRRGWRSLRRLAAFGSPEFAPLAFAALRHAHTDAVDGTLFDGLLSHSDDEPFAKLWNTRPDLLLRLALGSRAGWVQAFAVRALADAPDYCARIEDGLWQSLINSPFQTTAEFAYAQVAGRIQSETDPVRREAWLVLLLGSRHPGIAQAGLALLEQDPAAHAASAGLVVGVLTARSAEVRRHGRLLCQVAATQPCVPARIVALLLDWLALADQTTEALDSILENLAWVIVNPLRAEAIRADYPTLLALTQHLAVAVRCAAVDWLIIHEHPRQDLPPGLFRELLESDDARLLGAGLRLLGSLPEFLLAAQGELVGLFCVSEHALARQEAFRIVDTLLAHDASFGHALVPNLLSALYRREIGEGLHADLWRALTGPLARASHALPGHTVVRLSQARSKAAQNFGAWLLEARADADLPTADWIKLARCDTQAVRQRAMAVLDGRFDPGAPGLLLPILDGRWDDSRDQVLEWLKQRVPNDRWPVADLIALADHAVPSVRDLGCELLAVRLAEGRDTECLLALAEHPSLAVQGFVARWLNATVGDDPSRLVRFHDYFRTVLSQVNKGRQVKKAIHGLLRKHALQSETLAREVADLFEWLAVTVAIGDKAQYVAGLYEIQRRFPTITTRLTITPPAPRGGL
jgi:hypothetical protein